MTDIERNWLNCIKMNARFWKTFRLNMIDFD